MSVTFNDTPVDELAGSHTITFEWSGSTEFVESRMSYTRSGAVPILPACTYVVEI